MKTKNEQPIPIIAIVQGRMSSSRLPGKILLDIGGKPMLQHVIERTQKATRIQQVLVATTSDPSDDPVEAFCRAHEYLCFRGSLNDVLDRFYQALHSFLLPPEALVVRLTGDCPLIDPDLIDLTVRACLSMTDGVRFDFACTRLPPPWHRTFPIGQDVEVCTYAALERAWKEADQPYQREHVMPYLYEESRSIHYSLTIQAGQRELAPDLIPVGEEVQQLKIQANAPALTRNSGQAQELPRAYPDPFKVLVLNHEPDYGHERWTVDTPADLEFVRQVFSRLDDPDNFSWYDILEVLQREPELARINQQTYHKDYRDFDRRR